jgi:replicative DNA helicase
MACKPSKKILTQYVNKLAVCEILGSFLQQPELMKEYKVVQEDFPEAFHKLIFAAIHNLYANGAKAIDAVAIDEFLSRYETQYAIFKRNDGMEFVDEIANAAVPTNISYYYEQLKKFSLLREYIRHGIDVSEFFNPDEVDPATVENQRKLLDDSSVFEIINHFKRKQLEISSKFMGPKEATGKKAGAGGKEQKEKWKKGNSWGIGYSSAFLTTALYGLRRGRFTVKSAPSGTGKTRCALADLCYSCSPEYYDSKRKCWCKNPNGDNSVLYIGTEMELLEEIDPILWAYIADVPQEHIMFGTYEDDEEERVDYAIELLESKASIWLAYVPEYTAGVLEELIERHVVKHNIHHVFFDYIHTTVELIGEFATESKTKMTVREDQVLSNLSNKLKNMARKYRVSIDTATQVSGDYKNENNRDATIVRGAKAIIDKSDGAYIMTRPTAMELKKLEPIMRELFGAPEPNLCLSLYKNRGGKWADIRIWLYIDYGTMRTHDLFVTDNAYNLLPDFPKTYINSTDDASFTASVSPTFLPLADEAV